MNEYESLLARGGLSLDRLVTLCKVVDEGGLAKAAGGDISRLSQYSRQIKDLESFFGLPLLRKVGRVAHPTSQARDIASAARAYLKNLQGFVGSNQPPRPLVLGASQSLLTWYVMPRLNRLRDALGVDRPLTLMVMRSKEIAEALEDYRLDLGLVRKDAVPPGLITKPAIDFGYALFVPKTLITRKSAREILESVPLAISMGGELRRQIELAAAKEDIRLNITLTCTSFSLAADAVRLGLYAAILPDMAASSLAPDQITRLALPFRVEPTRRIVAAWHRSASSETMKIFTKALHH